MTGGEGLGPTRRRLEDDFNGDATTLPAGTTRSMRGLASEVDDLREGLYRRLDRFEKESRDRDTSNALASAERDAELRVWLEKIDAKVAGRGTFGLQTTVTFAAIFTSAVVGAMLTLLFRHI